MSIACFGLLHAIAQAYVAGPMTERHGERFALTVGIITDSTVGKGDAQKQGRLQGVLASITSLASMVGPLAISLLYFAYRTSFPGLVWIAGAALYLIAIPVLLRLPAKAQPAAGAGSFSVGTSRGGISRDRSLVIQLSCLLDQHPGRVWRV